MFFLINDIFFCPDVNMYESDELIAPYGGVLPSERT